jgi:V8-like Glu-specific endopeptidase
MKALILLNILNVALATTPPHKSLCQNDERLPSFDQKVARTRASLKSSSPCTATLISNNCFITAGHCQDNMNSWIVEFDTPMSDSSSGKMRPSIPENTFELKSVYGRLNAHHGRDWMVFSVSRNYITHNYPGEERGYYQISYSAPKRDSELSITGYGLSIHKERRNAQQQSSGKLLFTHNKRFIIHHLVDTSAGNSGSSIVETESNKIIGVHSHGGCRQYNGEFKQGNQGTLIAGNEDFISAIKTCMEKEREL